MFNKLFGQFENPNNEKAIIENHHYYLDLKEKMEVEENIIIKDDGFLIALKSWDELNNGSDSWKEIVEELIRGGIEREKCAIYGSRIQAGQKFEKEKRIDEAIKEYEGIISDFRINTIGDYPFQRLFIIYRKRKDYDNEIRVLRAAIKTFTELNYLHPGLKNSESYRKRVEEDCDNYRLRLEKILLLKNKSSPFMD